MSEKQSPQPAEPQKITPLSPDQAKVVVEKLLKTGESAKSTEAKKTHLNAVSTEMGKMAITPAVSLLPAELQKTIPAAARPAFVALDQKIAAEIGALRTLLDTNITQISGKTDDAMGTLSVQTLAKLRDVKTRLEALEQMKMVPKIEKMFAFLREYGAAKTDAERSALRKKPEFSSLLPSQQNSEHQNELLAIVSQFLTENTPVPEEKLERVLLAGFGGQKQQKWGEGIMNIDGWGLLGIAGTVMGGAFALTAFANVIAPPGETPELKQAARSDALAAMLAAAGGTYLISKKTGEHLSVPVFGDAVHYEAAKMLASRIKSEQKVENTDGSTPEMRVLAQTTLNAGEKLETLLSQRANKSEVKSLLRRAEKGEKKENEVEKTTQISWETLLQSGVVTGENPFSKQSDPDGTKAPKILMALYAMGVRTKGQIDSVAAEAYRQSGVAQYKAANKEADRAAKAEKLATQK